MASRSLLDILRLAAAIRVRNWLGTVDPLDARAYGDRLRSAALMVGDAARAATSVGKELIAALFVCKDSTTFANAPYSF